MKTILVLIVLALAAALAFLWAPGGATEPEPMAETVAQAPALGPVDGHDLAPTDIERVALGTEAPDFTLRAYSGGALTLSDYRHQQNVVLVFYRGHW